jgi:glucose/arabinose dehydrogenase
MLVVAIAVTLAVPSAAPAALTLAQIGTFASPVYVTAPPGDAARIFVVEKGGTIRIFRDGTTLGTPFLDITSRVNSAANERGLLSMAFAPDYANSGLFYVYYTDQNGDLNVDEFHVSANRDVADPASRRQVFSPPIQHRQFDNHNGGQLQFGPDGLLYAGTGDGGSGGDPNGNAQNPNSMLGKLLRIDPRIRDATPSIFALGLRNPWRFSFDRQTGDLVIGDVGQGRVEEVDFAAAPGRGEGANYGWNRFEGNEDFSTGQPVTNPPPGFTFPVITHTHSDGWISITGGYVVRDTNVPELMGRYVYGDFGKGDLWSATLPGASDDRATGLHVASLSSFGEDACGRVYAASLNGPVYRIESGAGTCPAPAAPPGTQPGSSPGPGAGTAGTPDRTAPTLRIGAHRRQRTVRRLRVAVACDERCHVTLRATALGRTAASRSGLVLAAGSRVVVTTRIRRAARRAMVRRLRGHRPVLVHVRVTAADDARNAVTRTLTIRVLSR